MTETAAQFGELRTLSGILTHPPAGIDKTGTAVVLLNAGIIHRSGPHRITVTLGRALAAAGFAALRFDFSGIGDSAQRGDFSSPRDRFVADTKAAISYCQQAAGVHRAVLVGNCFGSVVAFETALVDSRVSAICLVNGRRFLSAPDDDAVQQRDRRAVDNYYVRSALFSAASWRKLLTGRTNYLRLGRTLLASMRRSIVAESAIDPDAARIRRGFDDLSRRGTPVLLGYSAGDSGIAELELLMEQRLAQLGRAPRREVFLLRKTDHFITPVDSQARLVEKIVSWARSNHPAG
jgi:pimeloyl-ACP methyl ester carboxylesterase